MPPNADVRHLTVHDALEAIGSPEPTSGAGVAAGLALSLATACALKALNISLKRGEDQQLREKLARLTDQRDRALDRARIDAELFARFMQDRAPRDAAMLVVAAEEFQALAIEIYEEFEGMEEKVHPTVVADVTAARALHSAAVSIEGLIMSDNRKLRARVTK